ncbi:GNAT family N-acetyltransferase [Fodinicola feengrottensis]|uniref:GNAT family N-acetyltransferase n=1 Tax=Fodinicola feengrottensis TaxID=435914 RepID=UPI0024415C61|nr:GNAT family N-acetyltransferase [Fodinicola feengrottensis]
MAVGRAPAYRQPVGPARVRRRGMYVYPSARGQGVARQLLAAVLDWSRTKGIGIAELHATSMGAPLYESVGFQPATNYRLPL